MVFHIAQLNVAKLGAPLDSPQLLALRADGPTERAFTLKAPFPAPSSVDVG